MINEIEQLALLIQRTEQEKKKLIKTISPNIRAERQKACESIKQYLQMLSCKLNNERILIIFEKQYDIKPLVLNAKEEEMPLDITERNGFYHYSSCSNPAKVIPFYLVDKDKYYNHDMLVLIENWQTLKPYIEQTITDTLKVKLENQIKDMAVCQRIYEKAALVSTLNKEN